VVDNGKLVGVITEFDLIKVASHVLEADLKAYKQKIDEAE
jgi:CBS domain-containing protein